MKLILGRITHDDYMVNTNLHMSMFIT